MEVVGLWKSFNGEHALRGVNLTVRPGEIHGLLGLNGAGKTTTLKCLVGLLKPDRGLLRVCGINVTVDSSYKDLIGFLPENPPLPEYLTAKEFLLFAARLRSLSGPSLDQRVSEVAGGFSIDLTDLRTVLTTTGYIDVCLLRRVTLIGSLSVTTSTTTIDLPGPDDAEIPVVSVETMETTMQALECPEGG